MNTTTTTEGGQAATPGYNGWTNYETWAVALWLDNDESTYNLVREWACCAEGAGDLATTLRDFIEEANPLAESASVFTDLLGAAIESVDWHEVAANLLEDVAA